MKAIAVENQLAGSTWEHSLVYLSCMNYISKRGNKKVLSQQVKRCTKASLIVILMLAITYFITFYSFSYIYVFFFTYFFFYISFCLLFFLVVHCTGVGGTIPRGQSLCESMSLCRCLAFILCMPVCKYTLQLTLCAVYGYEYCLSKLISHLHPFFLLFSTQDLSLSIILDVVFILISFISI